MLKNWIMLSYRRFSKSKVNSIINIFGLSLGMTVFLLIFIYVKHEFSYDNFHINSANIYRLIKENPPSENNYKGINKQAVLPAPLAYVIKDQITGVDAVSRLMRNGTLVIESNEKIFYEDSYYGADTDLFDILTFYSLHGNTETVFTQPHSVAISETIALKYFGSTDVIGQVLELTGHKKIGSYTIALVYKDFPSNSSYQFNIILPFEELVKALQPTDLQNWNNYNYNYLIKTKETADPVDVAYQLRKFFITKYESSEDDETAKTNYLLEPLENMYLGDDVNFANTPKNDINRLYMLITIAVFVLAVAGINYVNLTTARSIKRAKEVGIRKVAGASQKKLIIQFLSDAIIICLVAMTLSVFLIKIVFPDFQSFIGKKIQFDILSDQLILYTVLAVPIGLGIMAGLYPAFVLSSFRPIAILKGDYGRSNDGNSTRNMLTIFQFAISGILLFAVIIIFQQLDYIESNNPGYDREHIIRVSLSDEGVRAKKDVLINELSKNPNILLTSVASYFPNSVNTQQGRTWTGANGTNEVSFYTTHADHNYLALFNIQLIAGRNFDPTISSDRNAFIINETAARTYGWNDPVGMQFTGENSGRVGDTVQIIGVMKDIHISSYRRPIEPFRIGMANPWSWQLAIKIKPEEMSSTIDYIERNYKKLATTKLPFRISFFDEDFGRMYKTDQQIGKLINLFSIIAVVIACLGLYGLSVHNVTQKLKEIGIRKILGANRIQVSLMVSRKFIVLVLVAFSIAAPISFIIMDNWLQTFAYHITIGAGGMVLTLLTMISIALITVGAQTWVAATSNPTKIIRNE